MELRAFEKEDHDLLIGWIDSDKLNYQWGGPNFEFPLDSVQISKHCSQAQVFPFIFVVAGQSAGYVELFKVSASHFRICRVFVSDSFRGKRVSKLMLGQLVELAKEKYSASLLSLAVFERNIVARNCYESLGFTVTSHENGSRSFDVRFGVFYAWKNGYNKAFKADSQRVAFLVLFSLSVYGKIG